MKYLDLVEHLQKENEGYVVLIKNGIFFIGVGKDAVVLNDSLDLKVTCMKNNTCKVGVPIKNIEKYIEKLTNLGKSFVIFDYNKELEKEECIYKYDGESIHETKTCVGCDKCSSRKDSNSEIIERIKNLGKSR